MRIKIAFEIGHSASQKNKASPEGFTHDWELFVRGADGNNISRFVDKVVFNLHESFPKPCRVYKEPPYVLKESGYASFNLPIDIFFKAGPRDDPKKFSITYDLDITKTTVQKYPLTISNPSNEFRHKLLEGGGIMINHDSHTNEERTYSQPDSTTAKPRPQSGGGASASGSVISNSANSSSKKHKSKSTDIKPTSTFENLFGPPILNSKNSPDPKLSNSNSISSGSKVPIIGCSSTKMSSQKPTKDRPSEKSSKEKRDKKEKSGSTPKDCRESVPSSQQQSSSLMLTTLTSSKKSSTDDKHERREEKRKDKSTTKNRERSKEKSSKRPPSPKPTSRSPKRSASPPRTSSSNSNRQTDAQKSDEKTGSSSGKKSKKEKRDKSKERDRSSTNEKTKESKHQMHTVKQQKDEKLSSKSTDKINGSSKKYDNELKERDKSNKYRTFDTKPPSPLDALAKGSASTESKKSHEKDERKHKHKKKDKNKDKDRKKSKSKDIGDSSPMSSSSSRKRTNALTPTQPINRIQNTKLYAMSATIPAANQLSEKSSSELDDPDNEDNDFTDLTPPKLDKVSSSNDTNQSVDYLIDRIPEVTPRSNQMVSPKKSAEKSSSGRKSKEPTSNQSSASKEEKKMKKRKSKNEKQKHEDSIASGGNFGNVSKRKLHSPLVNDEPPPAKLFRKDFDKMPKIKDDNMLGHTPPVPYLNASPSTQKYHPSPDSSKQANLNLKRSAEGVLSSHAKMGGVAAAASVHSPTTTSSSSPSSSEDSPESNVPAITTPSNDKQYIAQLKTLQHKIMTLQDNGELQQVVEMIAATGNYEITNRTFDFDLCALDRNTVQRLQERLG